MYRDKILEQIQVLKPSYLPEWKILNDRDPGWAVAKIFSNILDGLEKQREEFPSKFRIIGNIIGFISNNKKLY